LQTPLGPWKETTSPTWKWWKYPSSTYIYEKMENGQWQKWTRCTRRYQREKFTSPTPIELSAVPEGVLRASIEKPPRSERVTVLCIGTPNISNPTIQVTTLSERIQQLPCSAKWALQHLRLQDSGARVANALRTREAIAASDGRLKAGLDMAAFVVKDGEGCGRLKGVNKVPGPINEGDSNQCKVAGLYAIILMVKEVRTLYTITTGHIPVLRDNTTALKILDPNFLPDP
jgi:hypothetical protein